MFHEMTIKFGDHKLHGHLTSPDKPLGWIIFAHGSGSSRKSPRNNQVAAELNHLGFGALLFDLLTVEEDSVYKNRFNIPLLADRLLEATNWLMKSSSYNQTPIAYFGASTGAAAALVAAANAYFHIPLFSIVSRGGRPDLAGPENLVKVMVPTLLIVGSHDPEVIKLNERARILLHDSRLVLVPGATHLFEEPGSMEEVIRLAGDWFASHLSKEKFNEMRP